MKRWLVRSQLARARAKGTPGAGYTITEVMIVLAVTTAMFVAIAILFSGRQANVQFQQSVRNFEAELQNIMNDVSTGYYQSNLECTAGTTGPPSISGSISGEAGSNSDCIYLGKVIVPDTPATSSTIQTLVGRRAINGRDVETLSEASPVVAPAAAEPYDHSFGLNIDRILRLSDNAQLYGVGFLNRLAQKSLASDSEGEGLIELYGLTSTTLAGGSNIVNPANLPPAPDGVVFCLTGINGKKAEITIGASGSQSTVNSVLDTNSGDLCG